MENKMLIDLFTDKSYAGIKFEKITGRYVTISDIELIKKEFEKDFEIVEIGKSVQNRPIYIYKLGTGKTKVLAWSQMHGNESTTTKAIIDLLNVFKKASHKIISGILENCSLYIIPMLNPDGAEAYTRINANSVDLNRDLRNLSQPESKILRQQYEELQPDYCLNLHDQRTIFSAGNKASPATLSFLTPSKDEERSIDEARRKSMGLIAGIEKDLKDQLPGQIGRYDDAFNINCAGDTFQNLSTPTLLFEAGHYPNDYEREKTRKYVFRALLSCLYQISNKEDVSVDYEDYFKIPENQKLFNDIIIREVEIDGQLRDVAIQFREVLSNKRIEFEPVVENIAESIHKFGHREIEGKRRKLKLPGEEKVAENVIVNKIILNTAELQVKYG
ncbi:M14 family metallopeptidase [Christiangramia crocea]|uniref:M14 family metallopeptidase n=1 Tax=Christiangramia crocea TaxID=2904124 RepID=A0A9X1UZJ7_9FLAO|nr:M14 metallopeptidase family protein [Gramella crocea]MCG9972484.1 M14 family metallopeptidase [Gramella crocea]